MGMIRRSNLDRRITFQRRVPASGFMTAGQGEWQDVATVWAQVQDVLPSRSERMADGLSIANRPARIRMDWRSDITSDMQIIFGDRIMQIVAGPAEMGRRDGLEMMAENYSTAGGAA